MEASEIERQQQARSLAAQAITQGRVDPASILLEPIGGMTNRNYKVTIDSQSYVVRIPGEGTEEYVDRAADKQAAQLTSDLNVGAELLYYDTSRGTQITRFIEGVVTMSREVFQDPGANRRAAKAFRKLHTCGQPFVNRFDEKIVAAGYLEMLGKKGATLPEGYEKVQQEANIIREALAITEENLAPCHNDPAPENLVDRGDRVFILDWEFSGNNDPFWDLGDLSVETGFTEEQDYIFLEAYFDRTPTEAEQARMTLQKSLVFLLWTLWGVIQEVNKNPQPAYHFASYWDYAMDRFTRCQEIMNANNFGRMIDLVRNNK